MPSPRSRSQDPFSTPPLVLIRCTVVTLSSWPAPLCEFTSSLSQGMSFSVAPGALATALAVMPLPSSNSQPGAVLAHHLAVGGERRLRCDEGPGELAVGARLALVELQAHGMDREHYRFSGCGDRRGQGLVVSHGGQGR